MVWFRLDWCWLSLHWFDVDKKDDQKLKNPSHFSATFLLHHRPYIKKKAYNRDFVKPLWIPKMSLFSYKVKLHSVGGQIRLVSSLHYFFLVHQCWNLLYSWTKVMQRERGHYLTNQCKGSNAAFVKELQDMNIHNICRATQQLQGGQKSSLIQWV